MGAYSFHQTVIQQAQSPWVPGPALPHPLTRAWPCPIQPPSLPISPWAHSLSSRSLRVLKALLLPKGPLPVPASAQRLRGTLFSGKEGQRQGVPKGWGSEMQPSITMCPSIWRGGGGDGEWEREGKGSQGEGREQGGVVSVGGWGRDLAGGSPQPPAPTQGCPVVSGQMAWPPPAPTCPRACTPALYSSQAGP